MNEVSAIELQNTDKVLDLLTEIEDISYKKVDPDRPDIFEIIGPEEVSCILDVEETMVCLGKEICEIPLEVSVQAELFKCLLELNNEAIHGKFTIHGSKIYFKENLEIENLDTNELEAALGWTLAMIIKGVEKITAIIK